MVADFCRLSEVVYKPMRPIMGEEIQDIIADTKYIYIYMYILMSTHLPSIQTYQTAPDHVRYKYFLKHSDVQCPYCVDMALLV